MPDRGYYKTGMNQKTYRIRCAVVVVYIRNVSEKIFRQSIQVLKYLELNYYALYVALVRSDLLINLSILLEILENILDHLITP